jgi:hypothetical protein
MHHHGMFYNVAITTTYTATIAGVMLHEGMLKDLVRKSCAAVISETPILAVIPDSEVAITPYLLRLAHLDLDKCITFHSSNHTEDSGNKIDHDGLSLDLDNILQRQHNTPFCVGDPRWKLLIFNMRIAQDVAEFTASFIYSHSIGDGLSGIAFHMKFRDALASQPLSVNSEPLNSNVSTSRKPLLPPQEALNPFPVSIWFILKTAFNEYWPLVKPDRTLWTGSVKRMPLVSRYKSIRISEENTTAVRALCRQHDATITLLLQELVSQTLFTILPKKYTSLRSVVAISTRRWMNGKVQDDDMGLFVTALSKTHYRQSSRASGEAIVDWNEILQAKHGLHRFLRSNGKNIPTGLLFLLGNWHKYLQGQIGKHRSLSFEISNLGVFPKLDHVNGNRIDVSSGAMLFSQSISVIDSAIQISVVTSSDGFLAIGFSWQEDVVGEVIIESLAQSIQQYLQRV